MNSEELKKEFGLLMPSEINGFKRPSEAIPNNNDFFLEIPQLIPKDPVLYSTMNLIFSVFASNDSLLKQWHDVLKTTVDSQDWREVTDNLKGYMTPELKKKLDGIATGANNYVHPSTHPASIITQDTTHRFVTDTEKNTWNAKASTAVVSTASDGLAPRRDGNGNNFLAGDGTWKAVQSVPNASVATKLGTATVGENTKPIYLNGGTPVAFNSTIGNANLPVYLNNGVFTACNASAIGGIVGGSLTQNGWVKYNNGLILQWGIIPCKSYTQTNYVLQLPIIYNRNDYIFIRLPNNSVHDGGGSVPGILYNYGHDSKTNNTVTMHIDHTGICKSYVWLSLG